jgi:hypothetical protein
MNVLEPGVDHIALGSVVFESLKFADSAAGAVITFHGGSDMTLTGIHASRLTHAADFIVCNIKASCGNN